jgi:hypothetical protein
VKEKRISLPELALVAGTRAALGVGLGLLLADRCTPGQRRAVGWSLFLVGLASTVPLALDILGKPDLTPAAPREPSPSRMEGVNV